MSALRVVQTTCAVASFLLSVSGAGAAGSETQAVGRVLEIAVTPASRVSLTAREAPLVDVLRAIGEQAGVKIVLRGDFDMLVTQRLANMPLDAAIQKLSRWHSVVLIYDAPARGAGDPVLREAWVTSVPADRRNGPAPRTGVDAVASAGTAPPEGRRRLRRDVVPVEDQPSLSQASASAPAPTWRPSPAASVRSQANDSQLGMALKRGGPEGGAQVVEALVRQRGVDGAINVLREAATRDPDQGVRRGAIRVLSGLDSPDAVEAIRATLLDAHPGVRSEAHTALRRLGQPRQ
jgi:hypothetical protein